MYRSFLFSKEGNPNKRNVHNETCLHVLCQGPQILLLSEGALSPRLARPQRDEQRRADCLQVRTHDQNKVKCAMVQVSLKEYNESSYFFLKSHNGVMLCVCLWVPPADR